MSFSRASEGDHHTARPLLHEKLWPKVEGGGGCPVLTFAIRPVNLDDGEKAYLALKAIVDAEKAAKKAAKKAGLFKEEDEEV
jgi:hypothetical protein